MSTIDSALNEIMQLDFTSREILLEIFRKRQIESRREEIAKNAKKSIKDYKEGKSIPLASDDAIDYLNNL